MFEKKNSVKKSMSKKPKVRGQIKTAILTVLAVGGVISIALLAPNCLQLLKYVSIGRKRSDHLYYIKSVASKMVDQGLIEFKKNSRGNYFLQLTDRGQQELTKYQLREKILMRPKKWDGKWRLTIFDIKESRRDDRDRLRRELVNLGFVRLQNSVWVYPYECQEVIILLKSYLKFGWDIIYVTAENLENEKKLLKLFKL